MTCERCRELLTDYHFRELPAGLMKEVREHLDQCPDCRGELERLAALTSEVGNALGVEPFSEEEIRNTVLKAGALPAQKRNFHAWVWVPAAAVLLVGFLVVGVVRYGERSKAMEQAPTADLRQGTKGDMATPAPSEGEEREKQDHGMAFEENLPLQADGKGMAPDKKNEVAGRLSKSVGIPGMETQAGAKDRPTEREEAAKVPSAPEPVLRDAERKRMDHLKPVPPAAPPVQEGMQQLTAASGGEETKSQPAAAQPKVSAPDKDESLAGEERPRGVSKEKALEEADAFRAQGKLSGLGNVAAESSFDITKGYLKKGLLPPPESVREEDFTRRFPAPFSEEVRRLAEMLAKVLKGGAKASRADYGAFLDYVDSKKPALKRDPEINELIWMIETAAQIKARTSPAAGTGRDGFVPEPQP
jgi:hypothetical protein